MRRLVDMLGYRHVRKDEIAEYISARCLVKKALSLEASRCRVSRHARRLSPLTLGVLMCGAAMYLVPDYAQAQDAVCVNPVGGAPLAGQATQVAAAPGSQIVCGPGSTATGNGAVAIGLDTSAAGDESLAIGTDAEADGIHSVAIGSEAQAINTNAIAIGRESDAFGQYSIAVGSGAQATGNLGTSVGNNAVARAGDTAMGAGALSGSTASGSTVAVGFGAGQGAGIVSRSTIVGAFAGASASGVQNSFLGYYAGAGAQGANNVAAGVAAGAAVVGDNNISLGNQAGTQAQLDINGNPVATTLSFYSGAINIGQDTRGLSDDAIAIGTGAAANNWEGIAVGKDAVSGATGYNVAIGAGGTTANAVTASEGAVALGVAQQATGDGAVAIGSYNQAIGDGSVALGRMSDATGAGSFAAGDSTTATGNRAIALGSTASATTTSSIAIGDGADANTGGSAIAIGRIAEASAFAGIALGESASATAYAALGIGMLAEGLGERSIAMGMDAQASTLAADGIAIGTSAGASAANSIAIGNSAQSTILGSIALGSGSVSDRAIVGATGTIPAGSSTITYNTTDQELLGAVSVGRTDAYRQITNVADGTSAQDAVTIRQLQGALTSFAVTPTLYFHANSSAADSLAVGTDSIAVGPTTVVNGDNGIGLGNGAIVSAAAPGGTAIGQNAQVLLADAIAMGTSSEARGEQSIALGAGAISEHFLSVALGAGSITGPVVATASGLIDGVTYNYAGAAPLSTVSVGAAGAERTITNLGAGRVTAASTDAINGSQLFAAHQAIEEVALAANGGWNVSAQGVNATNVGPASVTGSSIDLNNTDTNIVVSKGAGSNNVTFNLAADIAVDSVTTGNTTVSTSGVAITGGPNGTVALANTGLDNGGNRITNVAAGVGATDAVNVSQLNAAIGNVSLGFTGNSGGTVTNSNGQILSIQGEGTTAGTYSGSNIRTVIDPGTGSVNIEMAEAPRFGTVTINENGSGQITGVAAATLSSTSTDAVNGSQLVALGDSIAATLSPGSTYNAATNSVTAQIVLGTNVYSNVQDALQAVNASVGGTWNVTTAAVGSGVATGSAVTEVAGGTTATFTAGNNIMIQQNGREVQVALNPNLTGMQSIAIAGGPTLNGDGINMNGGRITNVAAGVAPTDAVNLGQLNAGLSSTLTQANQYTDAALSGLFFDLSDYRRDANGGTAAAMAMGSVPQAFEPGMGIMGVGMSTWQGEQAIAVGFSKASDNGRVVVKATGTYNSRNQGGAAVGMGVQF